jgi:hypothetical protein
VQWDVLNMAIDGGWGDSAEYDPEEQREQLVDMLVELFTMNTDTLEAYDVEDYLTNVMHENYSTEVDDGSLQMVSKLLATMYVDVTKKKDFAGLIKVLDRYSKTGKVCVSNTCFILLFIYFFQPSPTHFLRCVIGSGARKPFRPTSRTMTRATMSLKH